MIFQVPHIRSILACAAIVLAGLGGIAFAQAPAIVTQIPQTPPPKPDDAPDVGDHIPKGYDSESYKVEANKRDFAEITFSVDADEEYAVEYGNGNYVRWQKKTRFDGKVRLKFVYGGGTYIVGGLDDMEIPLAKNEAEFIAEGWQACEKETDAIAMGKCTAAATEAGEAKFKKCQKTPPALRAAEGCGGGGAGKAPPFLGDITGPNRDKDTYNERPRGDVRPWEAMTCIGRTKVKGLGSGYDTTTTIKPYTFAIDGDHEAEALAVGTTQGCSAGATVNVKTGEVTLFLQPSPRNIMTTTKYSDFRVTGAGPVRPGEGAEGSSNTFRGTSRAPFKTFEGIKGDSINLHFFIPPGSKTFSGSWSPPAGATASPTEPNATHKVQTVVRYNFVGP